MDVKIVSVYGFFIFIILGWEVFEELVIVLLRVKVEVFKGEFLYCCMRLVFILLFFVSLEERMLKEDVWFFRYD